MCPDMIEYLTRTYAGQPIARADDTRSDPLILIGLQWDRIQGAANKKAQEEQHLQRVLQQEENAATLLQQRWRFIKARLAPALRNELKLRNRALRAANIIIRQTKSKRDAILRRVQRTRF